MPHTCLVNTPIGTMRAAAEAEALTGLWFVGQKYYPAWMDSRCDAPEYPVFEPLRNWLTDYFAGKCPKQTIPLSPQGTDFQQSVWELLMKIPQGQVVTYGEIAKQLNCKSAQAVGGAVGHNPISILIPCHRVIGANGGITGYAGGVDKKQSLLKIEKAVYGQGVSRIDTAGFTF